MANMAQAVRMALHYGETHLGVTDVLGEDVGPPLGGVFTATQGLKTAWNTPLDERGIIGTAMGIAYAGGRPVCEIQFCDYAFNVLDMFKLAGNQRWASGGGFDMPLVSAADARQMYATSALGLDDEIHEAPGGASEGDALPLEGVLDARVAFSHTRQSRLPPGIAGCFRSR